MANLLARLTMDWVPVSGRRTRAPGPPGAPPGEHIPIFTNPKALTFPIVVGLSKAAWEALKALPAPWLASAWVPFVICMAFGMTIAVTNLLEEKPPPPRWALGFFAGLLNSCVIFGAVMGIPGAKQS